MKKLLFLLLGVVIITTACQTSTELTDADKDAMVQAVKQASQEFWSLASQAYDTGFFNQALKFWDENSDQIWQTDPVAVVFDTSITETKDEWMSDWKAMIDNRIKTTPTILESHFSVLTKDKVLEVNKGDITVMEKDSTIYGPNTMVNTIVWANINGEWKMQFWHESWAVK